MNQLYGHEATRQRFIDSLVAETLHHAWLLYGMKGIGKHTLAEKLAGFMMCESQNACGECHACKMLAAGSHPDVYRLGLLEGKRDLNIEQVRGVLSFLSLSGAESGRRVVILDDAERMNNQAANALLKGLEEPSAGSVLLMVCSDLERLPATIRSRCMLQQCSPLSDADVRTVLQQQENPVQKRYLDLAVNLADGCPGAVNCLQNAAIASALLEWRELIADPVRADIGKIESWIRAHVKTVPHLLIARMLAQVVYPVLHKTCDTDTFENREVLQQALFDCIRWPGDVVRHSLRAGPALLACVLQLRASLKAI
ncbi:MAG: DNA polymerase III subunit delta' [Mariprofundus sp.]|nr:DNA polymerase III subunit delta' [Mariprofundus sp.]